VVLDDHDGLDTMEETSAPPPRTVLVQSTGRSASARLARFLFNGAVVLVFVAAMTAFILLVLERNFVLAPIALTVALMAIPFVADSSWRERIAVSMVAPFVVLGLVIGTVGYFAMFTYSWFERIFNGRGTFAIGFMLFAFGSGVAGGYVGYRCIRLAGGMFRPR
jgi:hypothetical protein